MASGATRFLYKALKRNRTNDFKYFLKMVGYIFFDCDQGQDRLNLSAKLLY